MTAYYCDTLKRKRKPTKIGDMQKSRIFYFNWLYKKQRPVENKSFL